MQGRKPVPSHLALVKGNPGKRSRNKREPKPPAEVPVPSTWLSERAGQIYGRLAAETAAMRVLTKPDGDALALLALRLEEVELCDAAIREHGSTYEVETKAGGLMVRARPEVAQRSEAMRHAQALLVEFGMTPSSRTKVTTTDTGDAPNKAASYF